MWKLTVACAAGLQNVRYWRPGAVTGGVVHCAAAWEVTDAAMIHDTHRQEIVWSGDVMCGDPLELLLSRGVPVRLLAPEKPTRTVCRNNHRQDSQS